MDGINCECCGSDTAYCDCYRCQDCEELYAAPEVDSDADDCPYCGGEPY